MRPWLGVGATKGEDQPVAQALVVALGVITLDELTN
jgi:hypothetical protein